jgi:beta-glucosidase/6-phospho-beta-glucosidase/beta-galactosidase
VGGSQFDLPKFDSVQHHGKLTPVPTSELVFPPPLPIPTQDNSRTLPSDFVWSVSWSAWQIEGALQAEGRGPSPFVDKLDSLPKRDCTDDRVTNAMGYLLYKQDIAMPAAKCFPYYPFSISWSRVMPFGAAGSPNQQAIDHYDDVINTCFEYSITLVVTLAFQYASPD